MAPAFSAQFKADHTAIMSVVAHNALDSAPLAIARYYQGSESHVAWSNLLASHISKTATEFGYNNLEHLAGKTGQTVTDAKRGAVDARVAQHVARYVPSRTTDLMSSTAHLIVRELETRKQARQKAVKAAAVKDPPKPLVYTFDDMQFDLQSIFDELGIDGADYLADHESASAGNAGMWAGAAGLGVGMEKVWYSVNDNKTRAWHAEMDGQSVGLEEPFEVEGEMLMYPLDDSMGASAKNIYGCRCIIYYQVAGTEEETARRGLERLLLEMK